MKEKKKIQQASIKGILYRNNKILVLKSKSGIWELPGGRMDFGESVEQAFKREMEEKLGFKKIRLGKFNHIWSFTSLRNGIDHHFIKKFEQTRRSNPTEFKIWNKTKKCQTKITIQKFIIADQSD